MTRLSHVYFILDEQADAVKIGVAMGVVGRLRDLQTGNPRPLRPLFSIPGQTQRERELHHEFAAARIHGEWFRYSLLRGQLDRLAEQENAVTYQQFQPKRVRELAAVDESQVHSTSEIDLPDDWVPPEALVLAKPLMTVEEVAVILSSTEHHVRGLVRVRALRAIQYSKRGRFMIPRDYLETYLRARDASPAAGFR